MEEKVFYSDENTFVSNLIFNTKNKTLSTKEMLFATISEKVKIHKRGQPIAMILIGIVLTFSGFACIDKVDITFCNIVIMISLILLVIGIFLLTRESKYSYIVRCYNNLAEEIDCFISKDKDYVELIVSALKSAIFYNKQKQYEEKFADFKNLITKNFISEEESMLIIENMIDNEEKTEEKIFYSLDDISISDSRFVLGQDTCLIKDISFVTIGETVTKSNKIRAIIMTLIGGFFLFGFLSLDIFETEASIMATMLIFFIIPLLILFISGILLLLRKPKYSYSVRIYGKSWSGEDDCIVSKNKHYIRTIVNAIKSAMLAYKEKQIVATEEIIFKLKYLAKLKTKEKISEKMFIQLKKEIILNNYDVFHDDTKEFPPEIVEIYLCYFNKLDNLDNFEAIKKNGLKIKGKELLYIWPTYSDGKKQEKVKISIKDKSITLAIKFKDIEENTEILYPCQYAGYTYDYFVLENKK